MFLAQSVLERNATLAQIVAALLIAIGGGFVGRYLRSRDKETKTLDYEVVSNVAIVTSHARPDTLKIVFGAVEVTNPFISQIYFQNTGKEVIETDDFLEPIEILRPAAKIIDFNIVEESEDNLVDYISQARPIDGQEQHEVIQIRPKTLNAGDSFLVQIVYDGDHDEKPSVTARIKGQTRKMKTTLEERPNKLRLLAVFLLLWLIMVINLAGLWAFSAPKVTGQTPVYMREMRYFFASSLFAIFTFMAIILGYQAIKSLKKRRR